MSRQHWKLEYLHEESYRKMLKEAKPETSWSTLDFLGSNPGRVPKKNANQIQPIVELLNQQLKMKNGKAPGLGSHRIRLRPD